MNIYEKLEKCPYCDGERLPEDKQPYTGLHCFTILYECGTDLTVIIGQDQYVTEKRCDADNSKNL